MASQRRHKVRRTGSSPGSSATGQSRSRGTDVRSPIEECPVFPAKWAQDLNSSTLADFSLPKWSTTWKFLGLQHLHGADEVTRLDLSSAAVNEQFYAGNETRVIRSQKQRHLSNFLGLSHAAHRDG